MLSSCTTGNLDFNLELKTTPSYIFNVPTSTNSDYRQPERISITTPPIDLFPKKTTLKPLISMLTVTPRPTIPMSSSSPTPSQTVTITPTETFTYSILRGKVIPERANCRYGPGAPYLYKYGLVGGSNLEIIGRNGLGTWALIRAIGGDNPCWVKAGLMEIQGDFFTVQPVPPDIIQAWSPYYAPLTGASAIRDGEKVSIFWHPLQLQAGDDSEQVPYIVEAWICQEGMIVFTPIGTYVTTAEVTDESGCSEASHVQVIAAEKHGYTKPVLVPWPITSP